MAIAKLQADGVKNLVRERGKVTFAWILASALPLWLVERMVSDVAGKTTIVDINVYISIAVAVSVVINVGQYVKGRRRRQTIRDQRDLITEYEERLGLRENEAST